MYILRKALRSQLWDIFLPLSCLVIYFVISTKLAVNFAPDEYMRLQVPFYIYTHNALPIGNEPSIINPTWGYSYAFTAYGPSMLSVVFMKIVGLFTNNSIALIIAARFTNVFSGALTVFLAMRIARRLFSNPTAPILAGVLIGFTPQFVFLSSYLNNDAPSACAIALIVLAWVKGLQDGWDMKSAALLGLGLGACSVTYYFGYAFILASIPVFFITIIRAYKRDTIDLKQIYKLVGIVFVVALVTGGWYFIRNGFIYHGDILGMSTRDALAEQMAAEDFKPSTMMTPQRQGLSVESMVFDPYITGTVWWTTTLKSTFGLFGYMQFALPDNMYYTYTLAGFFIVTVGILSFRRVNIKETKLVNFSFLGSIVIVMSLAVYYSWTAGYQAQGRYLYSTFVPFVLYAVNGVNSIGAGMTYLLRRITNKTKEITEERPSSDDSPVTSSLFILVAICYVFIFTLAFRYGLELCLTGITPASF